MDAAQTIKELKDKADNLLRDLHHLEQHIAALEADQKARAIGEILSSMDTHGIRRRDIVQSMMPGLVERKKRVYVPRYRDPQTGKTWTGQGRAPSWIADTDDRTRYLIPSNESGKGTPTDS
jgi:DNA-binding protein H-NS